MLVGHHVVRAVPAVAAYHSADDFLPRRWRHGRNVGLLVFHNNSAFHREFLRHKSFSVQKVYLTPYSHPRADTRHIGENGGDTIVFSAS